MFIDLEKDNFVYRSRLFVYESDLKRKPKGLYDPPEKKCKSTSRLYYCLTTLKVETATGTIGHSPDNVFNFLPTPGAIVQRFCSFGLFFVFVSRS